MTSTENREPKGSEPSSTDPCTCGHIRFRHQRPDPEDTHCSHPGDDCQSFTSASKPVQDVLLPKEG